MFNGKIHYKWSFSIAMLNYQRISRKSVRQRNGESIRTSLSLLLVPAACQSFTVDLASVPSIAGGKNSAQTDYCWTLMFDRNSLPLCHLVPTFSPKTTGQAPIKVMTPASSHGSALDRALPLVPWRLEVRDFSSCRRCATEVGSSVPRIVFTEINRTLWPSGKRT